MELTAIQSSVTLFEILCVIIVFATFFMRSRFFNEVFEHHPKWTTQILLMVFFGIMSIFGTLSGLSIYGAVVNVRDLGPMAAGLLCGPYIGIGSGIIGGLFRFSQGGPYMWTGLSAPILSGILGGIMYLANKRQFVPAWTAVLLIGLSETLISCYTLILVTKPSEFFTVVTTVAIPMIVFNIIGMVIFATVVHNILDERMIQKRMQLLELEVESKRNLSTIINTISFPVYVLDLNQRFVLVNDSFCRFIGRQRDEILLKTPRDFFNEGDLLFHHNLTDEDFQNQNSRENDMTITVPDGKKYAVISTSTVFKDAPCTGFVVGVFQDITRRKQAEKKLRQTTEYLNNLFNYANAPIIVWDTEFRITRFNHAFEYITGRTEQDVLGQPLDILFPADSRDASLTLIKKTLEGEHWKTVEIPILTKDGRILMVLWNSANVLDEDKKIISTIAQGMDITERKKMSVQIEASLIEKEALLKEVHHRVKNNLQIIASILNLQIRKIDEPTTIEALKDCQGRVRSMALVHEHLYRGKDLSHVDLGNYIRALGTVLFTSYDARERGARFELDIHDIYVDANTAIPLGLISNELITNSLKYAFKEKEDGKVSITATEDRATLIFVVADNGPGIPEHITLENQATLGLQLVSSLTDQLNGTVTIDRTAGTKFVITFPKPTGQKP